MQPSRNPNLPVTQPLICSTWLSVLFPFFLFFSSIFFSDLAVASSQYDILLGNETLVSDLRHVSEVLVPGFCRPVLLCRGKMTRARGMAECVLDGYGAFHQPKFECGCCETLVVRVCGLRQNFYVFLTNMTANMTIHRHQWLLSRLRMCVPRSCLWVI